MTSVGLSRLALAPALAEQVSCRNVGDGLRVLLGSTPGAAGSRRGPVAAGGGRGRPPRRRSRRGGVGVGAGAKPCGVAEPDGWAEARRRGAVGAASPDGLAEPSGWRCRTPGWPPRRPLEITGRNRSWAVWPTDLAASPLSPGTEMTIRSGLW